MEALQFFTPPMCMQCTRNQSSSFVAASLRPSLRLQQSCIRFPRNTVLRCRKGRPFLCMAMQSPAAIYASALAELAKSKNVLEDVNNDIELFGRVLENQHQVYNFLVNPIIQRDKKKHILKQIAEEKQFHQYTLNLLCLLVDKRRTPILKDLIKEFELVYFEMTETEVAVVTSAVEIQGRHLAMIADKIQSLSDAKNIKVKNVIDPSLIAGFTVRFGKGGFNLIDLSVKGQLEGIAAQLEKQCEWFSGKSIDLT